MQEIPIILFGKEYWDQVIDFRWLADEGVITDEHLKLIQYAETPAEAWDIISRFHGVHVPVAGEEGRRCCRARLAGETQFTRAQLAAFSREYGQSSGRSSRMPPRR